MIMIMAVQRQRISTIAIVFVTLLAQIGNAPNLVQAFLPPNLMADRSQHQRASTATSGDNCTTKTAIVLIDPVTDFKQVINAALDSHVVVTVQMPDVALPEKFQAFLPTTQALVEAGAAHTLSMHHRDVMSITQQLQILAGECNLHIAGIIPLSEVAVEVSDLVASCLGLPHNPLELMTARRDKGLMKRAVELAGLRVAKYARVSCVQSVHAAVMELSLKYPIVIKTPSVDNVGPDGRTVEMALLEEYIGGTEFAINLMAFGDSSHLLVTDMWKYAKTQKARYDSAEICNPADYSQLISYACSVAKAVGIKYGAAHVELKAKQNNDGEYVDPILIEVGARLSGGRKSIMAEVAIENWDPFTSLIEAHCGQSCGKLPDNTNFLIPDRFVRHIFLPIEKAGRIKKIQLDSSAVTTINSSAIIVQAGDFVKETTDIVSCAGFVWLVGERENVDRDTKKVLSSFTLVLD